MCIHFWDVVLGFMWHVLIACCSSGPSALPFMAVCTAARVVALCFALFSSQASALEVCDQNAAAPSALGSNV